MSEALAVEGDLQDLRSPDPFHQRMRDRTRSEAELASIECWAT
jgi:hypothetical protein